MSSKYEIILNGGADIAPQDYGEWREMKKQDEDEVVAEEQLQIFPHDELDYYSEERLQAGIY